MRGGPQDGADRSWRQVGAEVALGLGLLGQGDQPIEAPSSAAGPTIGPVVPHHAIRDPVPPDGIPKLRRHRSS